MGANVDWIVVLDASLEAAKPLAQQVRDWLIAQQIVSLSAPQAPSWAGPDLLGRGLRAANWDACPVEDLLSQGGVQIIIERRVFHTGDNGIQAFECPSCNATHSPDDVPWSDAVQAWVSAEPDDRLQCPTCRERCSIVEWKFMSCEWGFGNLAFGFWNWPIDERLVNEIASLTGHRCRLVHEHL
ncbi:hypothetical protein SAMN05216593_10657 [Pseudomonas asturiensis]|uniref:Uncharacterized protein n=1 Tax=Pseudomonas asturiensis TaxID=1190415 RepID=A0A1M7NIU4_9PSED|nr:hypothetical protein [Pseudomonas asturiensis]SHN03362.1 hypothetical protein SAMN05216593_10657 [Pseudomonas asturiensis]